MVDGGLMVILPWQNPQQITLNKHKFIGTVLLSSMEHLKAEISDLVIVYDPLQSNKLYH